MTPPGPEAPVVLVKWYDFAKWLPERVENFAKASKCSAVTGLPDKSFAIAMLACKMAAQGPPCAIVISIIRISPPPPWTTSFAEAGPAIG